MTSLPFSFLAPVVWFKGINLRLPSPTSINTRGTASVTVLKGAGQLRYTLKYFTEGYLSSKILKIVTEESFVYFL